MFKIILTFSKLCRAFVKIFRIQNIVISNAIYIIWWIFIRIFDCDASIPSTRTAYFPSSLETKQHFKQRWYNSLTFTSHFTLIFLANIGAFSSKWNNWKVILAAVLCKQKKKQKNSTQEMKWQKCRSKWKDDLMRDESQIYAEYPDEKKVCWKEKKKLLRKRINENAKNDYLLPEILRSLAFSLHCDGDILQEIVPFQYQYKNNQCGENSVRLLMLLLKRLKCFVDASVIWCFQHIFVLANVSVSHFNKICQNTRTLTHTLLPPPSANAHV